MRGGERFKGKRTGVRGGETKKPVSGEGDGLWKWAEGGLFFGLLLGWDAEEFAGVGALHFGSDRESGDIDELMFLSVGAVDEAWAAGDWGSEGEFGGGSCGDGWGSGLGFDGCRSWSGFRLWLGRWRGGGSDLWSLDGFWLGYRGGGWGDLWLRLGSSGAFWG